jgi:hypothetical protein
MILVALTVAGCGQKTEPEQAGAEKVAEAAEEKDVEEAEEKAVEAAEEKAVEETVEAAEEKPAVEPAQETEAASAEESEEEINIEEIVEASSEMATLDTEGNEAFLGAAPSGKYGKVAASEFEGDYYFDTDASFLILADGNTTQVYTGGTMQGAYFSVEEVELEGGIGETIVSRIKEVTEFLGVRMIGQPKVQLLETGDRRLAGFVTTYSAVDGSEVLFQDSRAVIGKCPRCGFPVVEREKGFFCQNRGCSFALWKNNRFFTAKRKELDSEVASALLNDGRAELKGCYSENKKKSYDATVLLEDDGERPSFRMVF